MARAAAGSAALPPVGGRARPSSERCRTKEKAKPRAFSLPPVPSRGPVKAPTVPAAAVAAPTPPAPSTNRDLEDWKRRNGLAPETRVFCITGAFPGIRKALVARGWHENDDKQSKCWDLKYALWQRDLGEMGELEESQVVNYFARNAELTSKVGLCNSLYNCCTLDQVDVDSFYPRSFDLTSPPQAAHFVEDFKLTTCRCLLRRFTELEGRVARDLEGLTGKAYPRHVLQIALDVCRRQARDVDDALDEAPMAAISEEEWMVLKARWIAQKYIENPLIVNGKKFDIRQWVLVTRWSPLAAWFYEDCYLRFSFADYNPKRLKNKYSHLTNNSISKHAEGFEEEKEETMWHSEEFREYLMTLEKEDEDPWAQRVQPLMKMAVLRSLEAAQENVVHRASSFELFGYDFMVDQDLNVWLIEINSSPDLSYSTSTTKQLVKAMIEDMMTVVLDVEKFGSRLDRPKRKWGSCRVNSGRFQLLEAARRRREEKFPKLRKDAQYLAVQGTGLKLRKPKKGECPRGQNAEDDPRYSASALLAATEQLDEETEEAWHEEEEDSEEDD